jgi:hypothetical protein
LIAGTEVPGGKSKLAGSHAKISWSRLLDGGDVFVSASAGQTGLTIISESTKHEMTKSDFRMMQPPYAWVEIWTTGLRRSFIVKARTMPELAIATEETL